MVPSVFTMAKMILLTSEGHNLSKIKSKHSKVMNSSLYCVIFTGRTNSLVSGCSSVSLLSGCGGNPDSNLKDDCLQDSTFSSLCTSFHTWKYVRFVTTMSSNTTRPFPTETHAITRKKKQNRRQKF